MKIQLDFNDKDTVYYAVLREVNKANPDMPYAERMQLFEWTLAQAHRALNTKDGVNVVVDIEEGTAKVA